MNTSHTPGPWHVGSGDGRAVFTGKHAKPIVAPNQADARLIAAAPDLLAALEHVVDCIEHSSHSPKDLLQELGEVARGAIKVTSEV